MRWTNYNSTEIQTGLKGTLESSTEKKNVSKAIQNTFCVCIAISQSLHCYKASLERFSLMKYLDFLINCKQQN